MKNNRDSGYSLDPSVRRDESELFGWVAAELEQRTDLSSFDARGTLSLALKVAGFLTRDVGRNELSQTLQSVLPGELRARGIKDAADVCTAIDSLLPTPDLV